MTVTLRALRQADDVWLQTWLADVAGAVGYAASDGRSLRTRASVDHNLRALALDRDGERAGIVIARLHAPRPQEAIIELVATPPAQSRRGSGMAAAAALEPSLRRAHVLRVYAPAPAMHGIDVYFWIRLGYRPLPRGEWPCVRAGVAWLARDL